MSGYLGLGRESCCADCPFADGCTACPRPWWRPRRWWARRRRGAAAPTYRFVGGALGRPVDRFDLTMRDDRVHRLADDAQPLWVGVDVAFEASVTVDLAPGDYARLLHGALGGAPSAIYTFEATYDLDPSRRDARLWPQQLRELWRLVRDVLAHEWRAASALSAVPYTHTVTVTIPDVRWER